MLTSAQHDANFPGSGLDRPIRVLVVDDHPIVREGVIGLLAADPAIELVGEADSGETALVEAERLYPDVVMLDIRLPGMSGLEAAKVLLTEHPRLKVIMLTAFTEKAVVRRATDIGVHGILLKETDRSVMRQAVHVVGSGGRFFDPQVEAKLARTPSRGGLGTGSNELTATELQVLELLPKGLTNKEIGGCLGVSVSTVKTHISHVMRKLEVRNRAEASAVALREGLA